MDINPICMECRYYIENDSNCIGKQDMKNCTKFDDEILREYKRKLQWIKEV